MSALVAYLLEQELMGPFSDLQCARQPLADWKLAGRDHRYVAELCLSLIKICGGYLERVRVFSFIPLIILCMRCFADFAYFCVACHHEALQSAMSRRSVFFASYESLSLGRVYSGSAECQVFKIRVKSTAATSSTSQK